MEHRKTIIPFITYGVGGFSDTISHSRVNSKIDIDFNEHTVIKGIETGQEEALMNYDGLIIGLLSFTAIGIFHPIVIKAEYYFSRKVWPVFAITGATFLIYSLYTENEFQCSIFAIIGICCLWSIKELFDQEKRVKKGWFPRKEDKKPNHTGLKLQMHK